MKSSYGKIKEKSSELDSFEGINLSKKNYSGKLATFDPMKLGMPKLSMKI